MGEFALIKSRVNLNRVNLGIALISDLKVFPIVALHYCCLQTGSINLFKLVKSDFELIWPYIKSNDDIWDIGLISIIVNIKTDHSSC